MFASFVRPRQAGKTFKVIELARLNPHSIILVHNHEAARHLSEHGIAKNRIFTHAQALDGGSLRGLGLERHQVIIDNVEYFLSAALHLYGVLDSGIIVTATGINL
jgi:hypothetical protein